MSFVKGVQRIASELMMMKDGRMERGLKPVARHGDENARIDYASGRSCMLGTRSLEHIG